MEFLNYTPLEKIRVKRPVDRISWILAQAQGKRVLDLGAYDETALSKTSSHYWLHERLSEVASKVIGFDRSDKLPREGLRLSERSVLLKGDVNDLEGLLGKEKFDVVVAGELIEHLEHPLAFLKKLKRIESLNGKQMILTTPNATAFHNVMLALWGRESCHRDHLQIYSYKTLHTLCQSARFEHWELLPYHASFAEMILASRGFKKMFLLGCERITNLFETLFPLLSGGWIGNIKI